jgi:hypothetical protein
VVAAGGEGILLLPGEAVGDAVALVGEQAQPGG